MPSALEFADSPLFLPQIKDETGAGTAVLFFHIRVWRFKHSSIDRLLVLQISRLVEVISQTKAWPRPR